VLVVIDLFSRQVVGFAMSERMTRQLVIDALRMAWFRRRPTNGLIFIQIEAAPNEPTEMR
jgi:putative transposase